MLAKASLEALVDFVNVPPEPIAGWRSYDGFDCYRTPM
jgi:hypothetical protein